MIKLEEFEKMVSYRLISEVSGSVGVEASVGAFTGTAYQQLVNLPDDVKDLTPVQIIELLQRRATVNLHADLMEAFEPDDYEDLQDIKADRLHYIRQFVKVDDSGNLVPLKEGNSNE